MPQQVFWFFKGADNLEGDNSLWTATTVKLPGLLFVDYVRGATEKDEWLKIRHCHRLDLLNARACALNLNVLTMHITLISDNDNNSDDVRIHEGLVPITITFSRNGDMHLAFAADMAPKTYEANRKG